MTATLPAHRQSTPATPTSTMTTMTTAFATPLPLPFLPTSTLPSRSMPRASAGPAPTSPRRRSSMASRMAARLTASRLSDAALASAKVMPVESSDALTARAQKYVFPMRADNTAVFFDQGADDDRTLMVVFSDSHHGMYLDCLSVLRALGVKCWRIAGGENGIARLLMRRIETELVSLDDLNLSMDNCACFWITDCDSEDKLNDDPKRLDQIMECVKMELERPNPRPVSAKGTKAAFHRVISEANRNGKTIFAVQTSDQPNLLSELGTAFARSGANVVSAAIETRPNDQVENTFYVTANDKSREGPLNFNEIRDVTVEIMKAIVRVTKDNPLEKLWFQTRVGSAVCVSEAIFIDDICNKTLATFAKVETPNFRGRLPDAPYEMVNMD